MAKRQAKREVDPVTAYALSVVDGERLACRREIQACQRHLDDLAASPDSGYWFDPVAAQAAIDFFGTCLRHQKGRWARAGQTIVLDPWQCFVIGSIFGWKEVETGYRRFRIAFICIPRKNGKSTIAAGVAIYCFAPIDREFGAEVYAAATKRDQAAIVFELASRMVRTSPSRLLQKQVEIRAKQLRIDALNSVFEPLSADARTMDGLNTHCAVIDELHAHKDAGVVEALRTSTGAREQPLVFEITHVGDDLHGICRVHYDYTCQVLDGLFRGDEGAERWFGYITEADEGDDWDHPDTWAKANPGFGVSVSPKTMAADAAEARKSPASQNAFKQRHCNIWVQAKSAWLRQDDWKRGDEAFDAEALRGRDCFAGLDLAKVSDLSSLQLLFPPYSPKERWKLLGWYWCPEDDIARRAEKDRVPYPMWREQGHLIATPGAVTDFKFIKTAILGNLDDDKRAEDIEGIASKYNILECGYDRTFAHELVTDLAAELTMVQLAQGHLTLGPPTQFLERLIKGGELQHGGHPITTWCFSNVVVRYDANRNYVPDKQNSRERIDGAAAAVNAMARAQFGKPRRKTVYDEDDAELMVV